MVKKFKKNQIYIILGTIVTLLMIFCIILFINESNNDDNNINNTTNYKSNCANANNETIINTTTSKKDEITTKETETTVKEIETTTEITTQESTTPIPTQPQTEASKPIETQTENIIKSTESTTQIEYRDPYTGQVINKEEYESIMDEINNPRQENTTTYAPKENVYVLNDDGTINFKKSRIYGDSMDEILLNYIYNSNEFQNYFTGKNIINISGQNGMTTNYIIYCHVKLENGELITFHFDENWNIIED